jgi:LPXTG-motif cell wall-anchored protein
MIRQNKKLGVVVYFLLVITMVFTLVATGTQICYGASDGDNKPAQSNSSMRINLETPATPIDTIVSTAPTVSTGGASSSQGGTGVGEAGQGTTGQGKTGDDSNLSFYVGILLISAGAIVVLKKKEANFTR